MQNYQERKFGLKIVANDERVRDGFEQSMYNDNVNTQMVLNACNSLHQQIESIRERKEKRTKVGEELTFSTLETNLVTYYNDQTMKVEVMMLGFGANHSIVNLVVNGKKEHFAILIGDGSKMVIGQIDRRSGADLKGYLVDAGIKFNSKIPDKIINKCLENYFRPKIAACNEDIELDILAGWTCNNKYNEARNNLLQGNRLKNINIPVQDKALSRCIEQDEYVTYFDLINRCKDRRTRCELVLYPIAASLASLLQRVIGMKFEVALNIVMLENINTKIIEEYLKVLNRDSKGIQSININDNTLKKWLRETKDETLLVDATSSIYEKSYIKCKKKRIAYELADLTTGRAAKDGISAESIFCNAVILSNEAIRGSNIAQIYLDNNLFKECSIQCNSDVIGGVITDIIYYVEDNIERIIRDMKQNKGCNGSKRVLAIVLDIVRNYFKDCGYDIAEIIGMPEDINEMDLFVTGNDINTEEIDEDFICAVRNSKDKYRFRTIVRGMELSDTDILVDDIFYYIPTDIYREILRDNSIAEYSMKILYKMKERGLLVVGSEGGLAIKKKTKSGRSFFYRIKKEAFDEIGMLPLEVYEGKEDM